MLSPRLFVALLCVFALVGAERIPKGIRVSRESILVSPWELGERMASDAEISFRVAMKQQNLDKLKDMLRDVSDPHSSVCVLFVFDLLHFLMRCA